MVSTSFLLPIHVEFQYKGPLYIFHMKHDWGCIYFLAKHDLFDINFCVNVKEFCLFFVTREKTQYFCMIEF